MSYYQRRDYKILPESVSIIFKENIISLFSHVIRLPLKIKQITTGAKFLLLVNTMYSLTFAILQTAYIKPQLRIRKFRGTLYQVNIVKFRFILLFILIRNKKLGGGRSIQRVGKISH